MAVSRYIVWAIAIVLSTPASAQEEIDTDKLAFCMVAHAGPADVTAMKELLVAALQDDVEGMKTGVAELGSAMAKLAMNACGARLSQLEQPSFEAAGGKFGELIATRIITEAFAKIE